MPYAEGYEDIANQDLEKQAAGISESLEMEGITVAKEAEDHCFDFHPQRLGTHIKGEKVANN